MTKDEDFHRLSILYGPPPKIIWIRLGNCATAEIAELLRSQHDAIQVLVAQSDTTVVALG